MISASEAKKITSDSVSTYIMDIEEGIKKNAALGKYRYEHTLDAENGIVDRVKERLKQQGFAVTTESDFGFDCVWRTRMAVSWETNEQPEEK